MKAKQGDIATIKTKVELLINGGLQVIVNTPTGSENRVMVATTEIISVEPGPMGPGDKVTKEVTRAKTKTVLSGTVVHRGKNDRVMVEWDDPAEEPSVEKADTLSRA